MSPFGQLLGLERGNPIGISLVVTVSLIGLGWWIYSSPRGKAAKALVDLRQQFVAWQDRETARYDALWAEKVELQKRVEALEGTLARLKAEHQIT